MQPSQPSHLESHADGRRVELHLQSSLLSSSSGEYSHDHHHGHGCSGHDSHTHNHKQKHDHGSHVPPVPHTDASSRPQPNDPNAGPSRRNRTSPYPMLDVTAALSTISQQIPSPQITNHPVDSSLIGHVLAADVQALESVPAFRASIVDGYAIRLSDDTGKKLTSKGKFPVAFVSHAEAGKGLPSLPVGSIARITTGAPLPTHADAVVMVEDTVVSKTTDDGREEAEIEILTDGIEQGENVREAGSDVKHGDTVLQRSDEISAIGGEFGLLASVGVRQVKIFRKPLVGVMSTGDEIVDASTDGELKLGEVRDTNRPTLLTAIQGCGFEAIDLGIAKDK